MKLCLMYNIGDSGLNDFFNCFHLTLKFMYQSQTSQLGIIWPNLIEICNLFTFTNTHINLLAQSELDIYSQELSRRTPHSWTKTTIESINGMRTYASECISHGIKTQNYKYYSICNDWQIYLNNIQKGVYTHGELFTNYITFNQQFCKHLEQCYTELDNGNYICLNYRLQEMYIRSNTREGYKLDYESDVARYIQNIKDCLHTQEKVILLCTDDQNILREFINEPRVKSFGYTQYLLEKSVDISQSCAIHLENNNKLVDISDQQLIQFILTDYFLMVFSNILIPTNIGNFSQGAMRTRNFLLKRFSNVAKRNNSFNFFAKTFFEKGMFS